MSLHTVQNAKFWGLEMSQFAAYDVPPFDGVKRSPIFTVYGWS